MTEDERSSSAPGAPTGGRELVAAFAERLERRDWPALSELLADDVLYEIPQTHERIRGRDKYVTFNAEFPGDWHVTPEVVLADSDRGCLLFRWSVTGESSLAIAFFEFADGRITRITDFWPDPYEPPPGREHLVERW
jgi:ketosteroid isomerase-like protein